jgi:putative ABC transport system substrate-binding protein
MNKRSRIRWLDFSSDNLKSKIQNLKWAGLFAIVVALTVCGARAEAQQSGKIPKIGLLVSGSAASDSARIEGLRQGLRELGYVEGKNIAIEYRFAEGNIERLPDLASELVRLKVDVILAGGTPGPLAAKQHTTTIPIVMTHVGDPVARGLVASLARPGGNITGLSSASPDLSGKRLELLKEIAPKLTRMGIVWEPTDKGSAANFKETEAAAMSLEIQLQSFEVRRPEDIDGAFKAATAERTQALVALQSAVIVTHRGRIVELATKNRLPTMFAEAVHVESGGLMSYGPNFPDLFRRAATYVDKILKGTKPADLPVERPMKFELVINLKTAKQIGLTIPQSMLYRADKVIK